MKDQSALDITSQFVLYTTDTGDVKLEVFLQNETIWLSQAKMAELFDVDRTVIGKHLVNIFASGELQEASNVQKMHVANSAKPVSYYNLDVIIAVGYRVNSKRATQFRIWASKVIKEYIIKGFALDDDRLKQAETVFGQDYFRQLLERIRSIRASERRIYLQITDIFERRKTFTMSQFAASVNKFLSFNEYAVLNSAGRVSHQKAIKKAEQQYDASNKIQKIDSDFAKYLEEHK